MKTKLLAAIAATLTVLVAGCVTTAKQKAIADIADIGKTSATLNAKIKADEPTIAAVTGTNASTANDFSYAETVTADAATLAPLLSDLIQLVPTSGATSSKAYIWTPKGIAACHRHHIDPTSHDALARLERAMRTYQT